MRSESLLSQRENQCFLQGPMSREEAHTVENRRSFEGSLRESRSLEAGGSSARRLPLPLSQGVDPPMQFQIQIFRRSKRHGPSDALFCWVEKGRHMRKATAERHDNDFRLFVSSRAARGAPGRSRAERRSLASTSGGEGVPRARRPILYDHNLFMSHTCSDHSTPRQATPSV